MPSMQQVAEDQRPALSVGELYGEVRGAITRALPRRRELWVRGEIHTMSDSRAGHCYIDLIDHDHGQGRDAPVLHVKCWASTWRPIKRVLSREGVELEQGMVVTLRGWVELYAARGEVQFVVQELDVTALLGRLALRRAALVRQLQEEGLLERNRALPTPAVPLRIGLVASPGSEGYRDFVGQLVASGFAFHILVMAATVQGTSAPRSVVRAVRAVSRSQVQSDLVVVVRGGGSKADLAAFDAEPVARAIATAPTPVWTGIGHTGDQSVADLVAARSFATPTECGRELAQRVGAWWEGRLGAAGVLTRAAGNVVSNLTHRAEASRTHLVWGARRQLDRASERLEWGVAAASRRAPRAIEEAHTAVVRRAARVTPLALGTLGRAQEQIEGWHRLLAAYDVERQLERGYTLTLDADARIVRSATALVAGERITTRFADGTSHSVVESVNEPATGSGHVAGGMEKR